MEKLPDRLPVPPERTAFKQTKGGSYSHVVTRADLGISSSVKGVITGKFVSSEPISSEKVENSEEKPENSG